MIIIIPFFFLFPLLSVSREGIPVPSFEPANIASNSHSSSSVVVRRYTTTTTRGFVKDFFLATLFCVHKLNFPFGLQ